MMASPDVDCGGAGGSGVGRWERSSLEGGCQQGVGVCTLQLVVALHLVAGEGICHLVVFGPDVDWI